jgi:hypothetical protein
MNPEDDQIISSLLGLVASRQWVPASSAAIGLLIRLSKSDVQWFPNLDARWRSFACVMLGILDGVLHKVLSGDKWGPSIAGGVFAACLAIATHEVVIEGIRGGRELLTKKPPAGPSDPGGLVVDVPTDVTITKRESRRPPPGAVALVFLALCGCPTGTTPKDAAVETGHRLSASECRTRALKVIDDAATCWEAKDGLDALQRREPTCVVALEGTEFKTHCKGDHP